MMIGRKLLRDLVISIVVMTSITPGAVFKGWCVKVIEGDRVVIYVNKKMLNVRLAFIDCPEHDQPYGQEATEFTTSLVLKKKVQVEIESYGENEQMIGRVIIDGKDLSMTLIESGLAWYYKEHGSERYLSKAQRKARKNKTGLWSQKKPVPPWEFREQAKGD